MNVFRGRELLPSSSEQRWKVAFWDPYPPQCLSYIWSFKEKNRCVGKKKKWSCLSKVFREFYQGSLQRLYCIVTSRANLCCRRAFYGTVNNKSSVLGKDLQIWESKLCELILKLEVKYRSCSSGGHRPLNSHWGKCWLNSWGVGKRRFEFNSTTSFLEIITSETPSLIKNLFTF